MAEELNREPIFAGWLEGELSEERASELLAELERDSSFREQAAKVLVVRRNLAQLQIPEGDFSGQVIESLQEEEAESLTSDVIVRLQHGRIQKRRVIGWGVGLASAAAIALGFFLWANPAMDRSTLRIVATESIGTLKAERLYNGERVRLKQGLMELDLGGRARVVIEAPAAFNVHSLEHIALHRGRCFAEMEKGDSGLIIETPSGKVLDLGTSFAVDVTNPEMMDVHVFDGEVEVSDRDDEKTLIKQGEAISFDSEGSQVESAANHGRFVPRVPRGAHGDVSFVHWSFDEGQGSVVKAEGSDPDLKSAQGVIVAPAGDENFPRWTEGVRGSALEFDGNGGWVNTEHPGISGKANRTVAGWIRIPADWGDREGDKAPLISWGLIRAKKTTGRGWMLSLGGPKNKRSPEIPGRLRLSLGEQQVVGTSDLRDGKWHHIAAVVMRVEEGPTALLYVDGELENVTRNTIESMRTKTENPDSESIRFGRQIYWDDLYLRGALDEFYLFEAALSGDQVRALMHGEEILSPEEKKE